MDVVQFGRWLAERRRACGWRSQRALVSAALADVHTREAEITAAFLARLEAGLLAHPFRGSVRKRVLALTWLLCKSPRQVRLFVQHAGITDLSRAENAELDEVCSWLAGPPAAPVVILPPRPAPFVGRDNMISEIAHALVEDGSPCVVISGMPGIGKSTLAAEAAHMLARSEMGTGGGSGGRFADGIIVIACDGCRGTRGLVAVLEDVLMLAAPRRSTRRSSVRYDGPKLAEAGAGNQGQEFGSDMPDGALPSVLPAALAGATDRVRAALAGKRMLVVLDNVDARLPLDQAVTALSTAIPAPDGDQRDAPGVAVLVTTRYTPRLSLAANRIHLGPLPGDDAVALFQALLGRALKSAERALALEACEAVGHVPVAISALAATASLGAVPLNVILAQAREHPLDLELDGGRTLHALYAEALDALAREAQDHYALLSVAEAPTLSFETVMAVRKALRSEATERQPATAGTRDGWPASPEETPEPQYRVETARTVEQLVRHSLLDVDRASGGAIRAAKAPMALVDAEGVRLRLPPLLRGYASERATLLESGVLGSARRELSRYALAYAERADQNIEILRAESELLHAAVAHAWQDGDHAITSTLVHQVFPLFYQFDSCTEIERMLRWGLQASQAQRTDRRTTFFLNSLGIVLFYRGDLGGARRAWEQAEALSRSLGHCPAAGAALHNLSQLADVEGDEEGAWQLADQAVLYGQRLGASWALGNALLLRGQLARRAGDRDRAHKDVTSSLEVFTAAPAMHKEDDMMRTSARAELARIERNYPQARQLASQVLDAANRSARLAGIELALEQAEYALDAGMLRDAQRLTQQASARAREAGAYLLDRRAVLMMRRATEARDQLRRPS